MINRGLTIGRVDVSEPASISTGIAARYATAIFEISKEEKSLAKLEGNLTDLAQSLNDSADLRDLITSPVISRSDQAAAIAAISRKMDLIPVMQNGLALMAEKRRLFVLPQLVDQLNARIAEDKGEITAEVTSAKALTKAQSDKLAKTPERACGQECKNQCGR